MAVFGTQIMQSIVDVTYSSIQRLPQVLNDVGLILQSHRESDQCVADPQDAPLFLWHWCMSHNRPKLWQKMRPLRYEPNTEQHPAVSIKIRAEALTS